jgi:hypothetical protein
MKTVKIVNTANGKTTEKTFSVNQVSQWSKFNDTALTAIATKYNITRDDINELIKQYSESKPVNKTESYAKLNVAIASVNAHNQAMLFCAMCNGVLTGKIKASVKIKDGLQSLVTSLRVQSDGRGMMTPLTVLPDRINKDRLLSVYWGNWVKQSGDDTGKDKRYYYYTRINPNAKDEGLSVMLKDRAFLEVFPQYNSEVYITAHPEIKTLVVMGGILTDDGIEKK